MEIIKQIKTHKSSGIPKISTYFLKMAFKALVTIALATITPLMHTSLTHGKIPTSCKASIVTPLCKEGSKDQMNNYRPISSVSLIPKYSRNVFTYNYQTIFKSIVFCTIINMVWAQIDLPHMQ